MSVLNDIEDNIRQLTEGWQEHIDYKIRIHTEGCGTRECDCPIELRGKTIRHHSLLRQLRDYAEDGDPGPQDDNGSVGNHNKSTSRPPGRVQGFHLLDEITVEAIYLFDRILCEMGLDRTRALRTGLDSILFAMRQDLRDHQDDYPHLLDEAREGTRDWVRRARQLLAHDERPEPLPGMVCGGCGGGLKLRKTPQPAVRCVGSLAAGPCGVEYPHTEWLALYEQQVSG
ncbi:hypothetical protein [Streptomyces sp. NPDC055085]